MVKKFFQNLSKNFCIYLLATFNLIHALQQQSFDWLLWVSLGLVALSLVLNFVSAIKEGHSDA